MRALWNSSRPSSSTTCRPAGQYSSISRNWRSYSAISSAAPLPGTALPSGPMVHPYLAENSNSRVGHRTLASIREDVTIYRTDSIDACQRHGDVQLLADDLDRPGDAGLAAGAEAVNIGTADQAALAPSASARITSWPERMPPSNRTSISEPTASAILGQHRDRRCARRPAAGRRDWRRRSPPRRSCSRSWRPPTSRMPLMISFPGQMLRIHSTSFQFKVGSN